MRHARVFRTRPAQVPVARHWARSILANHIPAAVASDAVVIVSELVSNAVEHSGSLRVQVEIATGRGQLHISVRDRGRRAANPGPSDPAERGRGLPIVRALARATTVHTGPSGWTVTAVLDLRT
jgi:anti-sigma regulatory factor (Ser/Thr protein kinase)